VNKFNEHGTILNRNKGNSGRKRTQRIHENIAAVRTIITDDPNSSVRRNGSGLSKSTYQIILKSDLKLHPYKMQIKHQLLETDYARRTAFCNWIYGRGPRFCDRLVVTDEAAFLCLVS
jgi:hypothetical protein